MPNTAANEDTIQSLIDELYEALDAPGPMLRKIAELCTAERDEELRLVVAFLNEQGAPVTASLLEDKLHRL